MDLDDIVQIMLIAVTALACPLALPAVINTDEEIKLLQITDKLKKPVNKGFYTDMVSICKLSAS